MEKLPAQIETYQPEKEKKNGTENSYQLEQSSQTGSLQNSQFSMKYLFNSDK